MTQDPSTSPPDSAQPARRGRGVRGRVIRSIYVKEVRETLRDRRTLFLLIAVPMIFYPMMMVLIAEVAASQTSKLKRTEGKVAITGTLPKEARDLLLGEEGDLAFVDPADPKAALDDGEIHVIIELPETFVADLKAGRSAPLTVRYNSVEPLSADVLDRVKTRLRVWKKDLLTQRLERKNLDQTYIEPLDFTEEDSAPAARQLGSIASQFLPMLVLIFMVTGAFYPAIDLTAGEKERKTIQTLLTSPVRPLEIVIGKYLTVLTVALISGLINITSILLIVGHNVMMAGGGAGGIDLGLGTISAADVAALILVVVMMGLMFSALMMTIATLAESPKEAQNYLTPVYMVCLIPVIIAQIPGIGLTETTAFIPVLNLALVMKQVLVEGVVWNSLFLVMVSSLILTVLTLALAARLYNREELIIGRSGARGIFELARSERGASGAWGPSPGEAMAFVSVLFVLLYYLGSAVQAWSLMPGLLITLIGLMALTVALTVYQKYDLKRVMALRKPPALAMIGATLMGLTAFIWVGAAVESFHDVFLPMPPEFIELMESTFSMPTDPMGKLGVVLVMALAPAICEEAVFRGWLLSSFRGRSSGWVAVTVTAVFFGVFHLSLYRFLGTATLGLLMGYMVWHTRSIWPAVLFHFLNNAASILSQDIVPLLGIDPERRPVWLVLAALTITAFGFALVLLSVRNAKAQEPEPARP